MEGNMKRILAVAVVAIIVVAAVVVVVVKNNDNKDSVYTGVALPVYGNADLDNNIDGDDLDIIEKIIAKDEGYTLEKYPFADANHDGKVDSDDTALVKKIIAGEKCNVYHLNYYNDGAVNVKTKVVSTAWPCEYLMTTYNSVMFLLTTLGADDMVKGSTAVGSTYLDKYMYAKILEGADALKTSYDASWNSMLDTSSVSAIYLKNDGKCHTVMASAYSNYDTYNEDDIEALGVDVVRFCESNPTRDETLASVLLAGFLTGKLDRATELMNLYMDIWDRCTDLSKTLSDDDKTGFITATPFSSAITLAGTGNQHGYKCVLAGGKSVLGSANQNVDTWLLEDEYNKAIDKIIFVMWSNGNNGYFFGNHELNAKHMLEIWTSGDSSNPSVIEQLDAYEKNECYVVYGDFPTAIDILQRAYVMYPDTFGDLFNEAVDKLLSFIADGEFADSNLKFVYSVDELENY